MHNHRYALAGAGAMDLVDTLNRVFPDEEKLRERLPQARDYAELCKAYLELKLSERPSTAEARHAAANAPMQLARLQAQAAEIQDVGGRSLQRVDEVTAGIKRLDRTKENLTQTVRMLRQLRMLAKLYAQLDTLLRRKHYAELATTITAASDLMEYFRPFRTVPRIAQLSQRIGELEARVYDTIQTDFGSALHNSHSHAPNAAAGDVGAGGSATGSAALKNACAVVDSLDHTGSHVHRDRLIQWYSQTVLREYFTIFAVADEAGSLENVSRRYAYLRNKVLGAYMADHSQWFPAEWQVRDHLVHTALTRTAQDLELHCEGLSMASERDMQLLVSALQETLDFERTARSGPLISREIEPFMSRWVEFQDRQLAQRVQSYRGGAADGEGGVLSSSKELVNLFRLLLAQLQKLTRSPHPTRQLSRVIAKWLGRYGQTVLMAHLPTQARSSRDTAIAGIVSNTAKYLLTTVTQLEEQTMEVTSTDHAGNDSSKKDSTSQGDDFNALAREPLFPVIDRSLDLLADFVCHRLDNCWRDMATPSTWSQGSVSDYAVRLGNMLEQTTTEALATVTSPGIIYDACFRIVEAVALAFVTTGMARTPRPVTEPAAEQMLLDLYAVKSRLSKLVEYAPESVREQASPRLQRFPERARQAVAPAEAVFKVLLTPTEPGEAFVENYVMLIKDMSVANFRKVLECKGARFQARAIEIFRKRVAREQTESLSESPLLTQVSLAPPRSGGDTALRRLGGFLRREY